MPDTNSRTVSHRYDLLTPLTSPQDHLDSLLNVHIRDAILVQCVQCSVAVLSGGSLVHVPEALHGGDVPLDALLGEVEF